MRHHAEISLRHKRGFVFAGLYTGRSSCNCFCSRPVTLTRRPRATAEGFAAAATTFAPLPPVKTPPRTRQWHRSPDSPMARRRNWRCWKPPTHTNVLSHDYYKLGEDRSIISSAPAALIAAASQEFANTLLFDNGDTIQGTARCRTIRRRSSASAATKCWRCTR